jgi:hypothetical protein
MKSLSKTLQKKVTFWKLTVAHMIIKLDDLVIIKFDFYETWKFITMLITPHLYMIIIIIIIIIPPPPKIPPVYILHLSDIISYYGLPSMSMSPTWCLSFWYSD